MTSPPPGTRPNIPTDVQAYLDAVVQAGAHQAHMAKAECIICKGTMEFEIDSDGSPRAARVTPGPPPARCSW